MIVTSDILRSIMKVQACCQENPRCVIQGQGHAQQEVNGEQAQ